MYVVTCRPISKTPEMCALNHRKGLSRSVFYVVPTMSSSRQRSCKHGIHSRRKVLAVWSAPRPFAKQLYCNASTTLGEAVFSVLLSPYRDHIRVLVIGRIEVWEVSSLKNN
jgi:hypothetical protein